MLLFGREMVINVDPGIAGYNIWCHSKFHYKFNYIFDLL